ncbi:MAG: DUF222 domain-containing protein, partial [Acidobacteriota bacterium]|nr:DUF222 domain-containing protein [Acidobacteriota bacterium]
MTVLTAEAPAEASPAAAGGALVRLDEALEAVRGVVADVDPDRVTGAEASLVLERFVKLERAVAAGRLGFARRASQCMTWREEGHRSAGAWLAQKAKISVGEAISTLDTAARLPGLPTTREALRNGVLSARQVEVIADAAIADPRSEEDLIEAAGYLSLKALQHRAALVKAARDDETRRVANIRKSRFLRHWLDPEGAFHLHAKLTPDAGADVVALVKGRAMFVAEEA